MSVAASRRNFRPKSLQELQAAVDSCAPALPQLNLQVGISSRIHSSNLPPTSLSSFCSCMCADSAEPDGDGRCVHARVASNCESRHARRGEREEPSSSGVIHPRRKQRRNPRPRPKASGVEGNVPVVLWPLPWRRPGGKRDLFGKHDAGVVRGNGNCSRLCAGGRAHRSAFWFLVRERYLPSLGSSF